MIPPEISVLHPGMLTSGNIDLNHRPVVHNPDGTISTVRSITVGPEGGGRYYLIPTVVGAKVVSNQAAIDHWRRTGQHLGIFASEASANHYATQLHNDQARQYHF